MKDLREVSKLIILQVQHNTDCGKDDKLTIDEIVDIIECHFKIAGPKLGKKPIGFTLLKPYPGCKHNVGYFERFTTGEFLKYPEIWRPIYE